MIRCPKCRQLYNPPQYGPRHQCRPMDSQAASDDDAFIRDVSPVIPGYTPPSFSDPAPSYDPPTPSYDGGGGDSGGGGSSGDY